MTFKLSYKGKKIKIRKEKPKVTNLVTLVRAFLAAENENRRLEDLPQADFGRGPKRFLLSVRTRSITENFVYWKLGPLFVFVVINACFHPELANALYFSYSGLSILLFSYINKVLSVKGCCVYMKNKKIHGCLKIWNFSSRVQLEISLVHCALSWAIELNTRREIPYLSAPMYYSPSNISILLSIKTAD